MLELETILAKASMDRVSMRDPEQDVSHDDQAGSWPQLAPNFAWDQYFQATGAPAFETLNVSQPDYIKQIAVDLANSSIDSWRAYFAYHLLRSSAPTLPEAFENEAFDFWSRYLSGAKEQRPRTARCVATVDRATRRPSGTEVHRADLRRRRQGADHATGGCPRKGDGGGHTHACPG